MELATLGDLGTPEDSLDFFDRVEAAGADSVSVLPAPDESEAPADVGSLLELVRRMSVR